MPYRQIRHFIDQQTSNETPRLAVNIVMADKATHAAQTLLSLHVFRCTHVELLKRRFKELLDKRSLHNKIEMAMFFVLFFSFR